MIIKIIFVYIVLSYLIMGLAIDAVCRNKPHLKISGAIVFVFSPVALPYFIIKAILSK